MIELPAAQAFVDQPISERVATCLGENGVVPEVLEDWLGDQRESIGRAVGRVELALTLTEQPDARDLSDGMATAGVGEGWVNRYRVSQADPLTKLQRDTRIVRGFMDSLGPSNPLHTRSGDSAVPGLQSILQLLRNDQAAVPSKQQRAELGLTAAETLMEIALLAGRNQEGAALSHAVADEFEPITYSPTASPVEWLEAMCRITDMRIRGLTLEAGGSSLASPGLLTDILTHQSGFEEALAAIWPHDEWRGPSGAGLFFEYYAAGFTRKEMLADGLLTLVRRARRHEDEFTGGWPVNDEGVALNFSSDMMSETVGGEDETFYQVRAHTSDSRQHRLTEEGRTEIPLPGYITMLFLDDFELAPGRKRYTVGSLAGLPPIRQ